MCFFVKHFNVMSRNPKMTWTLGSRSETDHRIIEMDQMHQILRLMLLLLLIMKKMFSFQRQLLRKNAMNEEKKPECGRFFKLISLVVDNDRHCLVHVATKSVHSIEDWRLLWSCTCTDCSSDNGCVPHILHSPDKYSFWFISADAENSVCEKENEIVLNKRRTK